MICRQNARDERACGRCRQIRRGLRERRQRERGHGERCHGSRDVAALAPLLLRAGGPFDRAHAFCYDSWAEVGNITLTGCLRAIRSISEAPAASLEWVASASPLFCFQNDGGTPIARPLRINDQIRIRQVRVIDDDGSQLGVMATEEALQLARSRGLDLIEVSPTAQPPVCRISDYGRLKYEQAKKDKDARKKQKNWELKEVKLRPKIEQHDYEVKARMAERLLADGGKVKVTIMFRGREITYTSFGKRLLDRMAADMQNLATVEREPKLEGKNMFMILAPRAVPLGPPKFSHKDMATNGEATSPVGATSA
ncbi:MAG TPA: translation initiation factor IF-3 [Candidatus Acidoferrales bacterium]|nr:translation initiation factor IF-3 [Candidatus Acidoferrales bacterium]